MQLVRVLCGEWMLYKQCYQSALIFLLEYFVYDLMCLSDYKYEKFIERTEKKCEE